MVIKVQCLCRHSREQHKVEKLPVNIMVGGIAVQAADRVMVTKCEVGGCTCVLFKAALYCKCGHVIQAHTTNEGDVLVQAECTASGCACVAFHNDIASVYLAELAAVEEAESIVKGKGE